MGEAEKETSMETAWIFRLRIVFDCRYAKYLCDYFAVPVCCVKYPVFTG